MFFLDCEVKNCNATRVEFFCNPDGRRLKFIWRRESPEGCVVGGGGPGSGGKFIVVEIDQEASFGCATDDLLRSLVDYHEV